jgi:hypothetical protein
MVVVRGQSRLTTIFLRDGLPVTHTMTNIQHANADVNLHNINVIISCTWNIMALNVFFKYDFDTVHSVHWGR